MPPRATPSRGSSPSTAPLPPEEGDNQALAVNTTDDSVKYDVAFAMVWVEDEDQVLNVNEAHAYASCTNCVTVAVAFQVVVVMDDAQVVVPQNLAVAANYQCQQCITAALASQLVLMVDTRPGEQQMQALAEVWARLQQFAQNIGSYSLTEIATMLEQVKTEIIQILGATPVPTPGGASTTTGADPTATPSSGVPTSGSTADPAPTEGATTTSSPEATTEPSASDPTPTADPTTEVPSEPAADPAATSGPTATATP